MWQSWQDSLFFWSSNDLILLYFGPLLDFKTIRIFAYSSTWEQANKRSAGTRPKADSFFGRVSLMRLGHLSLWHHILKRFWSLVFYQKVSLKGGEFWLRFFFKQNYGHACPTKFTVFSSAVLLHKFTILCCGIMISLIYNILLCYGWWKKFAKHNFKWNTTGVSWEVLKYECLSSCIDKIVNTLYNL